MRIHNTLLLTVTFSVSLLASGCGNKAGNASTDWPSTNDTPATAIAEDAPLPRACSLITATEAEAVIGSSAGQMADDPENCMWAGGANPGQLTMLMVQIMRGGTAAETASLFDNLTGLTGNLNMAANEQLGKKTRKSGQEIEGLGDAAWCSASNADLIGAQQLIVRSGTLILSLNVTGMSKGEKQASLCSRLEAAGRTALGRIGGAS
jgi:hypothetical protein